MKRLVGVRSDEALRGLTRALGVSIAGALSLQLLAVSEIGERIDRWASRPFFFRTREMVRPRALDERLKIFAFDDRTVAHEKDFELPLSDWISVISSLDARKPSIILIDKLFDRHVEAEVASTLASSTRWRTPIAIAAFLSDQSIEFRSPLSGRTLAHASWQGVAPVRTTQRRRIPYGAGALENVFTRMGHILYSGDGMFMPVAPLDPIGVALHLGLLSAQRIITDADGLVIDGKRLALDSRGEATIDFFPAKTYAKRSYSMLALIERARRGLDVSVVNEGDHVLILPAMYTGNTDWRETPFGSMAGGYHLAAVANGALTGRWLRTVSDPGIFVVMAVALGCALGFVLNPTRLLISTALVSLTATISWIALFAWGDVLLPALWPACGGAMALFVASTARSRAHRQDQVRAEQELHTATLVQNSFMPKGPAAAPGLSIRGLTRPASETGGDWWTHFLGSDGRTYIIVGDAIGHGVPAALVTAVAFAAIATARENQAGLSPELLVASVNGVLRQMPSEMAVMSLLVAAIDHSKLELTLVNAGHPMPILIPTHDDDPRLPARRRTKNLLCRGAPLGYSSSMQAESVTTQLSPGDRLLFFSDGIYENRGGRDHRPIGRSVFERWVSKAANSPGDALFDATIADYDGYVGTVDPEDDLTLVLVAISS